MNKSRVYFLLCLMALIVPQVISAPPHFETAANLPFFWRGYFFNGTVYLAPSYDKVFLSPNASNATLYVNDSICLWNASVGWECITGGWNVSGGGGAGEPLWNSNYSLGLDADWLPFTDAVFNLGYAGLNPPKRWQDLLLAGHLNDGAGNFITIAQLAQNGAAVCPAGEYLSSVTLSVLNAPVFVCSAPVGVNSTPWINNTAEIYQVNPSLNVNVSQNLFAVGNLYSHNFFTDNASYLTYVGEFAGLGSSDVGRTAVGFHAAENSSGASQTAVGYFSGFNNSGEFQTAVGDSAGWFNLGHYQTAVGFLSGQYNNASQQSSFGHMSGLYNLGNMQSCFGAESGANNTRDFQSAFGAGSGQNNNGTYQSVFGAFSGSGNTADNQSAFGYEAGFENTREQQSCFGVQSGYNNSAPEQTAVGYFSGKENDGDSQSAFGAYAGQDNVGFYESAFGAHAGETNTGDYNNFFGMYAGKDCSGDNVIAVGYGAGQGSSGSNSIYLGNNIGQASSDDYAVMVGIPAVNSTPFINGSLLTNNVQVSTLNASTLEDQNTGASCTVATACSAVAGGTYWLNDSKWFYPYNESQGVNASFYNGTNASFTDSVTLATLRSIYGSTGSVRVDAAHVLPIHDVAQDLGDSAGGGFGVGDYWNTTHTVCIDLNGSLVCSWSQVASNSSGNWAGNYSNGTDASWIPIQNDVYDLGNSTNYWHRAYINNVVGYANLSGRSGGQTLYGGVDPGDDLNLRASSASSGAAGNVEITAQDSDTQPAGNVLINAGTSNGAKGGDVNISAGVTANISDYGGNVNVMAGTALGGLPTHAGGVYVHDLLTIHGNPRDSVKIFSSENLTDEYNVARIEMGEQTAPTGKGGNWTDGVYGLFVYSGRSGEVSGGSGLHSVYSAGYGGGNNPGGNAVFGGGDAAGLGDGGAAQVLGGSSSGGAGGSVELFVGNGSAGSNNGKIVLGVSGYSSKGSSIYSRADRAWDLGNSTNYFNNTYTACINLNGSGLICNWSAVNATQAAGGSYWNESLGVLYPNSPSYNVSIGTTSNNAPLTFANSFGEKIDLTSSTPTRYGIGLDASGILRFYTNTATPEIQFGYGSVDSFTIKLRIDKNSNVHVANGGYVNASNFNATESVNATLDLRAGRDVFVTRNLTDGVNTCSVLDACRTSSGGGSSVGSSGSIQFSNGTGGFSADQSNLFWYNGSKELYLGFNGAALPHAGLTVMHPNSTAVRAIVSNDTEGISYPLELNHRMSQGAPVGTNNGTGMKYMLTITGAGGSDVLLGSNNYVTSDASNLNSTYTAYVRDNNAALEFERAYHDGVIDFDNQSRSRVHLSSSLTQLVSGTPIIVPMDYSDWDSQAEWSGIGTTTPQFHCEHTGYYHYNFHAQYVSVDAGPTRFSIYVVKSGVTIAQSDENVDMTVTGGDRFEQMLSDEMYCTANQNVTFWVSSSAVNAWLAGGYEWNFVSIEKQG